MSAELLLTELDRRMIAVSKALAADAVEKAGSGHPGTPISLASVAWLLYQREMVHDPLDPGWLGRDRFVLSIGHASLVQYIQLFLAGYDIDLSGFTAFRSPAGLPGHPEFGEVAGVETTTGPLGAGFANAVGLAMAARREHGLLDAGAPLGESVFDHFVYTVLGDGCMQEGVSSEAASLAGTQRLGNLIAIYDDNDISIEGNTDIAFTEDPSARFEAYGWQVLDVDWCTGPDGYVEDLQALHEAIVAARAETERPSLIRLHTIIAWPSPTKQGQESSHGAKLGGEEVAGLKRALGLDPEQSFILPDDVVAHARARAAENTRAARAVWDERFAAWQRANPDGAALLERLEAHRLPEGLQTALPTWEVGQCLATRAASGKVLSALAGVVPELWGGSADLAGSNNTTMAGEPSFLPAPLAQADGDGPFGRTIHFGVREHAMGSILNGIALDGLTRPYGGTFMVFSDYMRPAVRLAALMGIGSIFVWSHDSIGVGEDGPTHQPIEHLASLRAIPGLAVVRPGDANETAAAWAEILARPDQPAGIALSRQNLTVNASATAAAEGVRRGAYVLAEATDADGGQTDPEVVLIATGSEVGVAVAARDILQEQGTPTRVVSAPCLEWFAQQDTSYQDRVLPSGTAKVSIEAGIAMGWREIVGDTGEIISIDHYGTSAAGTALFKEYGFTANNIAQHARQALTHTHA
ncbi:transketolase [Actinomyces johnsonii F0542]|uniref:Transketolase n=1 Tax=Actinomyces johnsonii F0542 TaxID=1321818 RepID=U1QTF1_9ACTO|nr:transketolase [Actinomyces johnsonii]ERH25226.1 transketolase [Actinomyces johnsonii F0542]